MSLSAGPDQRKDPEFLSSFFNIAFNIREDTSPYVDLKLICQHHSVFVTCTPIKCQTILLSKLQCQLCWQMFYWGLLQMMITLGKDTVPLTQTMSFNYMWNVRCLLSLRRNAALSLSGNSSVTSRKRVRSSQSSTRSILCFLSLKHSVFKTYLSFTDIIPIYPRHRACGEGVLIGSMGTEYRG